MEAGAELIERARMVCGAGNVLTDPVALSTYRSDGIRRAGPLPLAVALPGNAGEVAAIVGGCSELSVPWVVRGAGTSRSGGCLPVAGGLLIALTRMRRILALDLADDQVTVEPGAPLATVRDALAPTHALPGEHTGTIGGAAARGVLATELLGLSLVVSDGSVVTVDARTVGYDIPGAFAGSHGTRGIAVSITLRAVPDGG